MSASTPAHVLVVSAPVDLALTAGVLRRLPSNALYPIREGEFRVILDLGGAYHLVGIQQPSPQELRFRGLGAALEGADVARAEASLRMMLGLDIDLAPAIEALEAIPYLAGLTQSLQGLRPPRFMSLWETLIQVIPFQQVSLAAAMSALNRIVTAFGERLFYEGDAYYAAPTAERLLSAEPETLRACGLSAAKVAALRGCAAWVSAGRITDAEISRAPDDEAALRLRELPGIGPWSAQLTLLRGFGRLGNFPSGDSGAARGLKAVFAGAADPTAAASEALAQLDSWRGYLYFMLLGRRIQAGG